MYYMNHDAFDYSAADAGDGTERCLPQMDGEAQPPEGRKPRRKISTGEWDQRIVRAQELRERYEKREISKEQYLEELNAL